MLAHIHPNRISGFKRSYSSSAPEDRLFNWKHPLKPVVGWFHRLAALIMGFIVILILAVWLVMRLLYSQHDPHLDDLTGYEAFIPGQSTNPNNDSFEMIPFSARPKDTNLDRTHMNSYMLSPTGHMEVVEAEIAYQQTIITRFTLYSNAIQLHDLLWRWGRPDYKQKDVQNYVWVIKWFEQQLTVSITSRKLNLDHPIEVVTITLN